MVDYSQPWQPNALNFINASTQARTQADVTQAGQIAAGGDYDAATKYLMAHGHMDQALQMRGAMQQAKADQLRDIATAHERIGNLALLANTPEQWNQALDVARKHGLDTSGYEDFDSGRRLALAMSGKAKDYADAEQRRRDSEFAQLKAAQRYQTTVPSGETPEATTVTPQATPVPGTLGVGATLPPSGALPSAGGLPATPPVTPQLPEARPATVMQLPGGEWTKPIPTPGGVDITEPLGGKGGAGEQPPKTAAAERQARAIQDSYKAKYGDELDIGIANSAVANHTSVERGEDGKPRLGVPSGSLQAVRQQRADIATAMLDPKVREEISEAATVGRSKGAADQRIALAGSALNHLQTVEQISDRDLEHTLGVIQGYSGYQKFLDAINSGHARTADSAAYHNAQSTLAVLLRETQNAYHVVGTGRDTDIRMRATSEALSPENILASPNIEVFRQRLANIRAILQGVINQPLPEGSYSHSVPGRPAATQEQARVSSTPEAGGQVQRAAPSPRPPKDMSNEELLRALRGQ